MAESLRSRSILKILNVYRPPSQCPALPSATSSQPLLPKPMANNPMKKLSPPELQDRRDKKYVTPWAPLPLL